MKEGFNYRILIQTVLAAVEGTIPVFQVADSSKGGLVLQCHPVRYYLSFDKLFESNSTK